MKISWLRGIQKVRFDRPNTFFCLGTRGSGKSSLLEHIGGYYLRRGHMILDLYESGDAESLCWLRSPFAKTKKILVLTGENTEVTKAPCETKPAMKLTLSDFSAYDIIISPIPLYRSFDEAFVSAAHITDLIYKRLSWKTLIYCIVRECANLYYSRLKVTENQSIAKSQMIYLIRTARHKGVALAMDSLRWYSVDVDLRSVSDYLFLKSMGMHGFSREYKWLYRYFDPAKVRKMPPQNFLVLTNEGHIGIGCFPYHKWHKEEHENILKKLGFKLFHKEPIEKGLDRGIYRTVGDKEHEEIITLYVEQNLGMHKISKQLGRSSKTISDHINGHNSDVERIGFCPTCKRLNNEYQQVLAERKH